MRKQLEESLKNVRIPKELVNEVYQSVDETPVKESELITTMCKRPAVTLSLIREKTSALESWKGTAFDSILWQADIDIKYEGYIARHLADIEKFKELEHKVIPASYDYDSLTSLSNESREKLKKIKPHSIGQASRIPGVSPTDISLLVIDLKR
jgi:tRNA uridine 5-carboxymethylaminomethyl modification enzyme